MSSENFNKFLCTYCGDEIPNVRVKCAECSDFDMCLQCFSAGAEIGSHKNNHAYQLVDIDSADEFHLHSGWSVREELSLLSGMERMGYGNWEEISQSVGTKTADECREKYHDTFHKGLVGKHTWGKISRDQTFDLTLTDPTPVIMEQDDDKKKEWPKLDLAPEERTMLGYMPLRDDFEKEYDNDCEKNLMAPLGALEDDDFENALKLICVDLYINILKTRVKYKRIAQDYQLITKFLTPNDRGRQGDKYKYVYPPNITELDDRFKNLCPFMTAREYEGFIRNIARQKDLFRRQLELERYRDGGCTRFEQLAHFDQVTNKQQQITDDKLADSQASSGLRNNFPSNSSCYGINSSVNTSPAPHSMTNGSDNYYGIPRYNVTGTYHIRLSGSSDRLFETDQISSKIGKIERNEKPESPSHEKKFTFPIECLMSSEQTDSEPSSPQECHQHVETDPEEEFKNLEDQITLEKVVELLVNSKMGKKIMREQEELEEGEEEEEWEGEEEEILGLSWKGREEEEIVQFPPEVQQPTVQLHPVLLKPTEPSDLLSHIEKLLCCAMKLSQSQFLLIKTLLLVNPGEFGNNNDVEIQIKEYIANNWF